MARAGRGLAYLAAGGALVGALALAGLTVGPSVLGWGSFVVLTGSMEPNLPVGSLVVTRPVPTSQLRPGDVVTFYTDQHQLVTHRVVRLELADGGLGLRTRGDANPVEDVWTVHGDDVVGTVVLAVPGVGRLLGSINAPSGRLAVAGALLGWIVFNTWRTPARRRGQAGAPVNA